MNFNIKNIAFATVAEPTRATTPSASVRANGKIMFSDSANLLIGYPKEDRLYFMLGTIPDETDVVYLVPSKAGEANTLKAAKNNASFQFNDIATIAAIGMLPGTRYKVEAVSEGDPAVVVAYKLTKKSQAEKDAEDKGNKESHSAPIVPTDPKGDARIAAKVAVKSTPKPAVVAPTKKELEAAAKKAAKADFKASR